MNRNAVRVIALIFCLIFTGFYYLVFNHSSVKDEINLNSPKAEENSSVDAAEKEIYWLQLGIFNEQGSVNELISRCAKIGIECHTYTKNDSITAFCTPTDDPAALEDIKKQLNEGQIEYYQKSALITDQKQLEKLQENSIEAYLEVILSLP